MLFYPPEHIISSTYVCKKWDEEMIKQVMGYFIPENMRVDHLISDFTRTGVLLILSPLYN
jgi:nardilysin